MASGAPGTETSTPRALRKRPRSGRKGDSATAGLDAAAVSSDEDALRELASVRRLLQRGGGSFQSGTGVGDLGSVACA